MNVAVPAAAAEHQVSIPVEGMSCSTCAGRIETALNTLPGVTATVNFATEMADVSFDPIKTPTMALENGVVAAGYGVAHEAREFAIGA